MDSIKIKSPAKINIGLNILNKREDSFHNLETIFYPLELFDEITIIKSNDFSFNSNDEQLNFEKTNLIIKAKEALESAYYSVDPEQIKDRQNRKSFQASFEQNIANNLYAVEQIETKIGNLKEKAEREIASQQKTIEAYTNFINKIGAE